MRLFYPLGAAALLATGILSAASTDTPDVKVVEEIVAKVNGDIITRGELEKTHALIEAELRKQGKSGTELAKDLKTMEADSLRDKIDQLLLVAKAKEEDVKVDAEITRRIAQVQAQSGIADPDKFHQWVFDQIGISFEDWKQQMTDAELTRRIIGQEVTNVPK